MKRPIVITLLGIALALVCLGIGAVIFFTANAGFPPNNPFDRNNIASSLEESKTLDVDTEKPLTLKVIDDSGSVTVTGEEVETVQVRIVRTAYDSSQARADEEVKSVKYTIEQTGNTITLKYELPRSMNFSNKVNTVDFFVTVPIETSVNIDSNFGDVSVASVTGDVVIANDFGSVTVENVQGAVEVTNNSGEITAASLRAGSDDIDLHSDFGAITLRNASGRNVILDSNSGSITLEDVRATGEITTRTDFGNTSFENGSGNSLSIETSSGRVSLVKLKMKQEIRVEDDFGEIELDQALASAYDLHTNSGSIVVRGAEGKLKAYTDFGGITIERAEDVTLDLKTNSGSVEFSGSLGEGPHMVSSDFGEIDLTLPADSKLDVDLSTDFGSINSDLPITVTLNESPNSDSDQIVGNINGGGDEFIAQTNSGSVTIHASR
jgi:putative adhesin